MKEKLLQSLSADLPERARMWGYDFAEAILIFAAFFIVSLVAKMIVARAGKHADIQRATILILIGDVVRAVIIIFGIITALGAMKINVQALVAGLGLTGFALGFAFKDALSNVLAGIMILLYHPFRLGDHVEVIGLPLQGNVTGIDLRYTTLTGEAKKFLMPNSILLSNAISLNHLPPVVS